VGAFTGAKEDRQGLLEAADGGTVFLDEVGNLPMDVQKTLLRFIQEREFLRLGDTAPRKVDVRILSATNTDLKAATRAGAFREDLFTGSRVNSISRCANARIHIASPRTSSAAERQFGTTVKGFTRSARRRLAYRWPGNVRELEMPSRAPGLELGTVSQGLSSSSRFRTRAGAG
jgi:transcriptional regulator with PAS, ATPase and Fis domain